MAQRGQRGARREDRRCVRARRCEPETVVVVLENAETLELAALDAERQAASADGALIQLDVRTHSEQKQQESSLAGLRAELRDADRHAAAADRLAPQGLMSEIDRRDAESKAKGLGDRVKTEEDRRGLLETGRGRQLAAQRIEVERLRDIAKFRRHQLAALQVRAGIRGPASCRTCRSRTDSGSPSARCSRRSPSPIASRPR